MATVYELDDEQSYEAEIGHCAGVTGYDHWFFVRALSEALNKAASALRNWGPARQNWTRMRRIIGD